MSYVNCKISSDYLYDLLMERVRFWTDDRDVIALFGMMYERYVEDGYFDGGEFDPMQIVDNDYANWCSVLSKGDAGYDKVKAVYDKQGFGDCSCEDADGWSFIEEYNEANGDFLVRQ